MDYIFKPLFNYLSYSLSNQINTIEYRLTFNARSRIDGAVRMRLYILVTFTLKNILVMHLNTYL